MLGYSLMVLHNLRCYNRMMEEIRDAIENQQFDAYKRMRLEGFARNGED